jgi:hypothetical protein
MAAKNNRFRPVSRRLPVGALGTCALLLLAAFAGIAARSRAQSTPAQQPTPPPSQPSPKEQSTAPTKPAAQPAPASQSNPAKAQKNADSDDDDQWPDPEWEHPQNQTPAPASNPPSTGAQTTSAGTQKDATGAPAQPAPETQPLTAPAQPDAVASPPAAQPATAAAPALARPIYPGMTPEDKRKQQVADECAYLLKLATELKTEVDKTRKDELSVGVVRKAAALEQMARKVRTGTAFQAGND